MIASDVVPRKEKLFYLKFHSWTSEIVKIHSRILIAQTVEEKKNCSNDRELQNVLYCS